MTESGAVTRGAGEESARERREGLARGIAWDLVSGLALIEPISKAFGVPRRRTLSELRLLGTLVLDCTKP